MIKSEIEIRNTEGKSIKSVEDRFRLSPPKKKERQWKDGRSAKELAKVWFKHGISTIPEELTALFNSHSDLKKLVITQAISELKTPLDNLRGETRNHDLILQGSITGDKILVGIEAKVDEAFGPIINEYLNKKRSTRSKAPERINNLARAIFGKSVDESPALGSLRYQLLHGLAGTLIAAKNYGAKKAVFVVHEFIPTNSSPLQQRKFKRNSDDFHKFFTTLFNSPISKFKYEQIYGPACVPGGEFVHGTIPIYIGKIQSVIT
jgi:hypothetical protein